MLKQNIKKYLKVGIFIKKVFFKKQAFFVFSLLILSFLIIFFLLRGKKKVFLARFYFGIFLLFE